MSKKSNLKSRVIVRHSQSCFYRGTNKNPWSGIPVATFWGNFAANSGKRGSSYLWISVSCNDPNCPAIKAVDSRILEKA